MKRVVSLCIALIRIHTVDAMDWIIKSQTLETVPLSNEYCRASSNDAPFACTF